MRAKIALLGRVVARVDKDRIVRTSRDASLAPDANRLVKVDDPVRTAKHRRRRAGRDARRVIALIATRYLKCSTRGWKRADVDRFDIRSGNGQRDVVFRLASRRARMTTNTPCMVDYFRVPRLVPGLHVASYPGLLDESS